MATSRRRSAVGRLSMGAVLTTWLLDALGLSASVALAIPGFTARPRCTIMRRRGRTRPGRRRRRRSPGRSGGTGHERGLPGPRSGGGQLVWAAARGGAWVRQRRQPGSARHDDDLRRAASRARRWRGLLIVTVAAPTTAPGTVLRRHRERRLPTSSSSSAGNSPASVSGHFHPRTQLRIRQGCADPRRTRCCCHRLDSSWIGSSVGREARRCKYGDPGS